MSKEHKVSVQGSVSIDKKLPGVPDFWLTCSRTLPLEGKRGVPFLSSGEQGSGGSSVSARAKDCGDENKFKMAAKTRSGGTQRVLQKLNKSIEDGEYYEAHQLIRTVYFRLVSFQVFHMGLQEAGVRYFSTLSMVNRLKH